MQKKLTLLIGNLSHDLRYPIRRAQTIIRQSHETIDISVIAPQQYTKYFMPLTNQVFPLENGIYPLLETIEPDLLLYDETLPKKEMIQQLQTFIPSMINLDDLIEARSSEQTELTQSELVSSKQAPVPTHSFMIDDDLQDITQQLQKQLTETMPLHLVVLFSERDPSKLTYRALRHLTQLHIPLNITIVIGEQYAHDVMDLKMMALQRSHTRVVQTDDYGAMLKEANIVLCSATYFPYEVATMGVPCIVLAENDAELNDPFLHEQNGFLHLGLGRKVKQSILLNAVMEFVLHEGLRKKMATLQLTHSFSNKNHVADIIYDALEQSAKNNPLDMKTSNML